MTICECPDETCPLEIPDMEYLILKMAFLELPEFIKGAAFIVHNDCIYSPTNTRIAHLPNASLTIFPRYMNIPEDQLLISLRQDKHEEIRERMVSLYKEYRSEGKDPHTSYVMAIIIGHHELELVEKNELFKNIPYPVSNPRWN